MKTYQFSVGRRIAPKFRSQASLVALICALAMPTEVPAQTALDSAAVTSRAATRTAQVGLRVLKTGKDGGFTITVTNQSAQAITGAVVRERIGNGLMCPAENNIKIEGYGAPKGSFTLAVLISPGITLGTLPAGQSVTLTYSCQAS